MQITVAPNLTLQIEARIKEFLNDSLYSFDMRKIIESLHILPLFLNMGSCIGIRPTGEMVVFQWEKPEKIEELKDVHLQLIAIYQGSLKYQEFKQFVPSRPPEAQICSACNGTGIHPFARNPECEKLGCACGGLGWVLP